MKRRPAHVEAIPQTFIAIDISESSARWPAVPAQGSRTQPPLPYLGSSLQNQEKMLTLSHAAFHEKTDVKSGLKFYVSAQQREDVGKVR